MNPSNQVSNLEYLQFVLDGGYTDERWWCDEGANLVKKMKLEAPRFWLRSEEEDVNSKERSLPEAQVYRQTLF